MIKLGHIEIFVREPLQARDFYVDALGFELVAVQGEDYVWVKSGTQEILLRRGANAAPASDYHHAPQAFVLYTDDLPRASAELQQKGVVFRGDDTGSPTFTDPDGNWFQLADPDH
jgi:catechol 2,3-dioxygenase-like lactoylglutathione lyase family enzyme